LSASRFFSSESIVLAQALSRALTEVPDGKTI
jgi:hypothetical protein